MSVVKTQQLNFNTILLIIVSAIITYGVNRVDKTNTLIIKTTQQVEQLSNEYVDVRNNVSEHEKRISKVETEVEVIKAKQYLSK